MLPKPPGNRRHGRAKQREKKEAHTKEPQQLCETTYALQINRSQPSCNIPLPGAASLARPLQDAPTAMLLRLDLDPYDWLSTELSPDESATHPATAGTHPILVPTRAKVRLHGLKEILHFAAKLTRFLGAQGPSLEPKKLHPFRIRKRQTRYNALGRTPQQIR